ncbi:zinc finger BED domain-containing protein 5 [Nephila pilipes]|uniref:Zinc finger BED domain-containing protein 5 n=1 Tax=Nephila pilipes TaxID=299642 RepID=A0A8X6TVM0_NEPPI|nr:zinc finger BED domain-containing protein 5 [Nephila pilipes]
MYRKNDLEWDKCVNICSNGTVEMIGKVKGAVSRMKQVAKNATSSHYVMHRLCLTTRRLPQGLKLVLDGSVKIINHIKSPLHFIARSLQHTAGNLGMDHLYLVLHTEMR